MIFFRIIHCMVLAPMLLLQSRCTAQPDPPGPKDYYLVYQDDFNGDELNTAYWSYTDPQNETSNIIGGKKTLQRCSNDNVLVRDGKLYLGTNLLEEGKDTRRFSNASVRTVGKLDSIHYFKYGYFEIRAKLPKNPGNGAAFWIQCHKMGKSYNVPDPAANGAEIDIFEYGAATPEKIFYSLHWNGYDAGKTKAATVKDSIPGLQDGYHTFALEWRPEGYIVYVDNKERARSSQAISRQYSFIILSSGVGGFGGNYLAPGNWPDYFLVDYVKFYRRKPEVRLYSKSGWTGAISPGLLPGNYTAAQLQSKGISFTPASVEIPLGWKLVFYEGSNFSGRSVTLTKDDNNLHTGFRGVVRSLKIIKN